MKIINSILCFRCSSGHGQNLYKGNIAAYDRDYADGLEDYLVDVNDVTESGRDFNGTASPVSAEAAALLGDQQFEMYTEYKGKSMKMAY